MKQGKIHTLLNRSATGHSHVQEDREHAFALATKRSREAENKAEDKALLKDFENAMEDKGVSAITEGLGALVRTAIDIFAPADHTPTLPSKQTNTTIFLPI